MQLNTLNRITNILNANAEAMPLETMYKQLEAFTGAYDDLQVKGNILQDGMQNTLAQPGTQRNVDSMMNGLKADVALEMGADPNLMNPTMQKQQMAEPSQQNNDFYADLKNL